MPKPPAPPNRLPRPAAGLLAAAALCAAVTVVEAAIGADRAADYCGPATVALSGLATILVAALWAESASRTGWRLIGASMLLYGAGLLALQTGPAPPLGLLDPGNLLRLPFYPALFVAIAIVWRGRQRHPVSVPIALNAAVFSLVLGAFAYELLLNGLAPIGSVEGPNAALIAFPALDLLLLMCLTLAAGQVKVTPAFPLVAAGLLVLAAADVSFAVDPADGLHGAATALGWPLGMLATASAAAIGYRARALRPLRGASLYAVGTGIFGASLALLVWEALHDRDPVVIALASTALCLATIRFAALARENDRLARDTDSIISAAGEGIYRLDAAGAITYINPSAVEALGFEDERELLGRNAHDLIHHSRPGGASYPKVECPVCHTVKRGVTNRVTGEVYWRPDGTSFPVAYTSAPIRDGSRTVGAVVVFDDVSRQQQLEQQLRAQAIHDPLTGLYNRLQLEREIADQLRYAERYAHGGALILFDLDAFKLVNDSIGHSAGDRVLCDVAAVLADEIDEADVVARIGGDEFAVLLREADRAAASRAAKRLIASLRERVSPSVGASAGIALFDGARRSPEDLLVCADLALLEVKEAGGAAVLVGSRRPQPLTMVEKVREALAEGRLTVYAQPIVEAATGRVVREELLVRMYGDHGEVLTPDRFLPQAERFGLIQDIDLFVLGEALGLARAGRAVSVNVSSRSLGDARFLARIEAAVAAGVDPALLWVEITETSAVANMTDARQFATALRELGCTVALDDFGTGFSSFAYLKNIPVQVLKIDMDFIRDLPHTPSDQHLVRAIVAIAESLGVRTVAEGVEQAETLAVVHSLGVDLAQGWHLGVPQPALPPRPPALAWKARPAQPRHGRPLRTRRSGRKHPASRFPSPPVASRGR